jgi:hypothetical protein
LKRPGFEKLTKIITEEPGHHFFVDYRFTKHILVGLHSMGMAAIWHVDYGHSSSSYAARKFGRKRMITEFSAHENQGRSCNL